MRKNLLCFAALISAFFNKFVNRQPKADRHRTNNNINCFLLSISLINQKIIMIFRQIINSRHRDFSL